MRACLLVVGCALVLGGCCGNSAFSSLFCRAELRTKLTANPSVATTGEAVTLQGLAMNARGRPLDPLFDPIAIIAWDYDGDGREDARREAAQGDFLPSDPRADVTFSSPGTYRPGLFMAAEIDDLAVRSSSRTTVVVRATGTPGPNLPPNAALTAPARAGAGEEIVLDGTASSDPDGTIVRYQWDKSGDGGFHDDTGSVPWLVTTYNNPGVYEAALLVTDDDGATATATQTIVIVPQLPARARAAVAARARRFTAVLRGGGLGTPPPAVRRGEATTWTAMRGRGSMRARLSGRRRRGDGPLARLLRGRWRTRVNGRFDARTLRARLTGVALVRARRDRACLRFSVRVPPFGRPRGTLRLRGGTGRFRRLRVTASFTPTQAGDAVRLAGAIRVRAGAPRRLPRRCGALR